MVTTVIIVILGVGLLVEIIWGTIHLKGREYRSEFVATVICAAFFTSVIFLGGLLMFGTIVLKDPSALETLGHSSKGLVIAVECLVLLFTTAALINQKEERKKDKDIAKK